MQSRSKMNIEILSRCVIVFSIIIVLLAFPSILLAETYYVNQNHPEASDDNPGTEEEPFLTVQKGINTADFRDTVFIKNGIYDMAGYS
jgi:hypothetical protein